MFIFIPQFIIHVISFILLPLMLHFLYFQLNYLILLIIMNLLG